MRLLRANRLNHTYGKTICLFQLLVVIVIALLAADSEASDQLDSP